ncbi:hypothetical protein [Silanimonas sp.]|uniref:PepSY domain-containing protein n=1 Tax=Silanimonas sp. TaxID=1929290 RepID=UPI001BBA1D1E|nr:hypothetical protein [Silanimonas sp.]MBS3895477.1 PepSY domain-containing protein [Silanimonas sp.]MBS3924587.1 PepSY domain-containing protein [Xanthomonadaceae bacterium]
MRVAAPSALLVLSAGLLAMTGLRAQDESPQAPPVAPRERSELPESVLRAERQTGGEVLRAERMQRDGRDVYRLKVLTPDGRVRIMREDPRERRRETWRDAAPQTTPEPFAPEPRSAPGSRHGSPEMPETLPPIERGDHH